MSPSVDLIRRAARKPPRVIARRAREEAARELQQLAIRAARSGKGPLAPARILRGDPAEVARVTAAGAASLGAWASALAAADREAVAARAARALRRMVEVFGDEPVAAGVPPRWNDDIRSGFGWPQGWHRRIDYVNRGRPSDVKVAWELSRLRHLVALAPAAALGDDAALEAIESDLAGWRAANPMGWSVNWASAMEVALRAVNLVCVDAILLAGDRERRDRSALLASLYEHGWFLFRNLEVSDVNGNHFLADAVGLVWLGAYFGPVGEAGRWRARGLEMVREAARDQVLDDGLDHEGSLPYHVLVLEMLLVARAGAGEALPGIDPALRRMLDAAVGFCDRDGRVPNVGDDDGGRVLAFADAPSRDARRVLALGAALVGHDDAAALAGGVHLDDVRWLCGPEAAARLEPPRPAPVPNGRLLRDGGIAVLGRGEDHVVVPVGPVGFRGRGGHGHLDALSPVAVLGGRLAVRDSGTATYTGDPALRNRLRDVFAHSTVVLDATPYARIGGPERLWGVDGDAPPEVERFSDDEDAGHVVVAAQTLPSAAGPVPWRRSVRWRPGRLEIEDRLAPAAGTRVEARLHVPPDVAPRPGGLASAHHEYALGAPDGARLDLERVPWSERYGSVGDGGCAVVRVTGTGAELVLRWDVTVTKAGGA
jgi:Heparinase II/III-like protein/Heparinase II/III N-terminus